jgi:hypothetical protein
MRRSSALRRDGRRACRLAPAFHASSATMSAAWWVGSTRRTSAPIASGMQLGLPISVEVDRGTARVFGSAGYFTPGVWFAGGGIGAQATPRVAVSASSSPHPPANKQGPGGADREPLLSRNGRRLPRSDRAGPAQNHECSSAENAQKSRSLNTPHHRTLRSGMTWPMAR